MFLCGWAIRVCIDRPRVFLHSLLQIVQVWESGFSEIISENKVTLSITFPFSAGISSIGANAAARSFDVRGSVWFCII